MKEYTERDEINSIVARLYTNVIFLASLQFDKHPYHTSRTMENVIWRAKKKKKWKNGKIGKNEQKKTKWTLSSDDSIVILCI